MTTAAATLRFPNLYGKSGQRRPDVKRRLNDNVVHGSLLSASLNPDRVTYRVLTAGGTEFAKVTLAECDMLSSVAMSAYNEGRANR